MKKKGLRTKHFSNHVLLTAEFVSCKHTRGEAGDCSACEEDRRQRQAFAGAARMAKKRSIEADPVEEKETSEEELSEEEELIRDSDPDEELGEADDSEAEEEEEGEEEEVSDGEIDEHDSLDEEEEDDEEEEESPQVSEDDDSSDDETMVNTVGNIPMKWYDGEDHIGYDREGNKIARPATTDQIQDFVNKADDPEYWRSVFDQLNQKKVVLTDEELKTIARIRSGSFAHSDKFDPFQMPAITEYDPQEQAMALSGAQKPKSSFIPSKWEAARVRKMVKAIREVLVQRLSWLGVRCCWQGRFSKRAVPAAPSRNYLIWDEDVSNERTRRGGAELIKKQHIPAPKPVLPGHAESYNPPDEYLPTEEERTAW